MGLFTKRKLAVRRGSKYQYGKSPIFSSRFGRKKLLRSGGPTSFHRIPAKSFSLRKLFPKIPSKVKKITAILGTIGVVAFLTYTIAFSNFLLIKEIKPQTDSKTNTPELMTKVADSLKSFKNKNIIFAKKSEMIAKIQRTFPEIENVKISKDLPSTILIKFEEYPIVANITNMAENGTNKKYLISSIGYAIKENENDPNLPFIKIKTVKPINTDGTVIEPEKLKYILNAMTYFKEKFGMKILEAEYKVIPRELHLKTEKYFIIWLDIQKPFEDQFRKLKKALVKLDIFNESLEYIDLRISGESGDKIIYKRKT